MKTEPKSNRLTFSQKLTIAQMLKELVEEGIIMPIESGGCYLKAGWTMKRIAEAIDGCQSFHITVANVSSIRADIYGPLVPAVSPEGELEARVTELEKQVSELEKQVAELLGFEDQVDKTKGFKF